MNIVVASDDNYVPHLITLVASICENNKDCDLLNVYVLNNNISESRINAINALKEKYANLSFNFVLMTDEIIRAELGANVWQDRSLSAFARIFIPRIVEGDKALYLDVDGIAAGRLSEYYSTDLSGFAIAGVLDTNNISRHRAVGLSDDMPYINSGSILFNLNLCREIDFTKQCIDFINSKNGQVVAMDQGTINGVLSPQNLIKIISPENNVFTTLFELNSKQIKQIYGIRSYYSDEELAKARKSPVFVHFTSGLTTRPWEEHCKHPLREEYWKYRIIGEMGPKALSRDKRSGKQKIVCFMYRYMTGIATKLIKKY